MGWGWLPAPLLHLGSLSKESVVPDISQMSQTQTQAGSTVQTPGGGYGSCHGKRKGKRRKYSEIQILSNWTECPKTQQAHTSVTRALVSRI